VGRRGSAGLLKRRPRSRRLIVRASQNLVAVPEILALRQRQARHREGGGGQATRVVMAGYPLSGAFGVLPHGGTERTETGMGPTRFYIGASKTCFRHCGSIRDVEQLFRGYMA
jgi:hypothetical protein